MILPFSTQLNGKPTYFVEKIQSCLIQFSVIREFNLNYAPKDFDTNILHECMPKLHTIREDKKDRWKPGVLIDFFINCRQKDMFRFAPRIPVVSTQRVYMSYAFNDVIQISVGNKELFGHEARLKFAQNDGFDTWQDFFDYFYPIIKANPDNFLKMKLIHWTDKRY